MSLLAKFVEPAQKILTGVKAKLAGITATNPKDGGKNR